MKNRIKDKIKKMEDTQTLHHEVIHDKTLSRHDCLFKVILIGDTSTGCLR